VIDFLLILPGSSFMSCNYSLGTVLHNLRSSGPFSSLVLEKLIVDMAVRSSGGWREIARSLGGSSAAERQLVQLRSSCELRKDFNT
jgi:hypothetical protein